MTGSLRPPTPGAQRGTGSLPAPEWRRKAVHAATGVLAIVPLVAPRAVAVATLVLAAATALALDGARLRSERWRRALTRLAPGILRPDEARVLSGASFLAVGYAAAVLLFAPAAAAAGMLCLAAGDAAAALVGQAVRRRRRVARNAAQGATRGRPTDKTAAGTFACWAVSLVMIAAAVGLQPLAMLAGATVAALVERLVPGRWDNLVLPSAVAAAVQVALGAAGGA
ncbi:MAG: hypothetical protein R6X25_04055 [Candidatus Krumholzibacteriia bacterium]